MVAALRSDRGASRALLIGALVRQHQLLLSVPLMIQYESAMTRPEHLKAAGLSSREVGAILDAVAVVGEPIRVSYLWRPLLPDPSDEMVLEAAVNGRADMLVTINRRHFEPARTFAVGLRSPAEALLEIRRRDEEK